MTASVHWTRGLRLIRAAGGAFRVGDWTLNRIDPDGRRCVATVSVWVHGFAAACLLQLVYRPARGGRAPNAAPTLLFLALVAFTGYQHYRLASGRPITWRWTFAQSAVGGGFAHFFIHLLYYPVLVRFAVFVTSFRLTMACVTAVAVVCSRLSPPPRGEGHISIQRQFAGIQSNGGTSCIQ